MQQKALLWSSELFQRREQVQAARALNDGLIAGEFPIEGKSRSGYPNQRMKPQNTERDLIDQPDQVVASLRMGYFMHQNSREFLPGEDLLDSIRQRDARMQNAIDCRPSLSVSEPDRYAPCDKSYISAGSMKLLESTSVATVGS